MRGKYGEKMCIASCKGELLKIEILKRARRLAGVLNILIDYAQIGLGSSKNNVLLRRRGKYVHETGFR